MSGVVVLVWRSYVMVLDLICFAFSSDPYQSYAAGGPADVTRGTDNRRSYGMESVEDDPFIEAHFASLQSMNSTDGKKKKPNNVNYGYMSQGK